jgi:hypothetical protein
VIDSDASAVTASKPAISSVVLVHETIIVANVIAAKKIFFILF